MIQDSSWFFSEMSERETESKREINLRVVVLFFIIMCTVWKVKKLYTPLGTNK